MTLHNIPSLAKIVQASITGLDEEEFKKLYIEANTFRIGLDDPVYRVVEVSRLLSDVKNKVLSHTRIGEYIWGDDLENPLLQYSFADDVTNERISLHGLVYNKFGVSWTKNPNQTSDFIEIFSHNKPSVILKSTPRKLLNSVMNVDNQFYMLHHHIGMVEYVPAEDIEKFIESTPIDRILDSLGQSLILSVLLLSTDLRNEEEVRLVYSHSNDSNWAEINVKINTNFALIPFNWDQSIIDIQPGFLFNDDQFKEALIELSSLGLIIEKE